MTDPTASVVTTVPMPVVLAPVSNQGPGMMVDAACARSS